MSPEEPGLPPPPPREPAPPVRDLPDLPPGTVDNLLSVTRSSSEFRTARYQDTLELRADVGGGVPDFAPFKESGPDPLGELQSSFEATVLGDKPDPSTLGLLRAIGGAMLAGTSSPIASITDQYQVAKIRELQKQFLEANNDSLIKLSDHLAKAKAAMRELSAMMAEGAFRPSKLSDLLQKKRRMGDSTLEDIEAALERTTDPDEHRRLEAMRDDLKGWMAERDERAAKESAEVGDLIGRLQGMEAEMHRHRGLLERAAWSEGPRNSTSGGKVVDTSHHRPDALEHVSSLYDMVLSSKTQFERMIAER